MSEQRGVIARRFALNEAAAILQSALDSGCEFCLPIGDDDAVQEAYNAVASEIEKLMRSLVLRAGREVSSAELIRAFE